MSRLILGIDPGLSGAVAVFAEDGQFVDVFDLPIMQTGGKQSFVKNVINAGELCRILSARMRDSPTTAYVETVTAMPKQGVSSMFSMGHTLGSVVAVLSCLMLPVVMVRPQEWKKAMGLVKAEKDQSRALAIQRVPQAGKALARVNDHNRAEAMLLAMYGLSQINGGAHVQSND